MYYFNVICEDVKHMDCLGVYHMECNAYSRLIFDPFMMCFSKNVLFAIRKADNIRKYASEFKTAV